MKKLLAIVLAVPLLLGAYIRLGGYAELSGMESWRQLTQTESEFDFGHDMRSTIVAPVDSEAIYFTIRSLLETGDTQTHSGAGHAGSFLGWFKHTQESTYPLGIPVEGKCENTGGGTLTTCVGVESQLSENNGTTGFIAFDGQVTKNNGTLNYFYLARMNMGGNTQTVPLVSGLVIDDLPAGSGSITAIKGLHYKDQTQNSAAGIAIQIDDADAPIQTKGQIQHVTAGGGTVSVTSTSTSSNYTQTRPDATGEYLLDTTLVPVVGTFTRSADAASGDQSITGLGGTPILIEMQMTDTDGSNGFLESSLGRSDCTNQFSTSNNVGIAIHTSSLIYFNHANGSTDTQVGSLSSCDSDGFTISWTKAGSPPSETLTMAYTAWVRK